MRTVTTERAHDPDTAAGHRAARLRIVAVDGELVESREALRVRPLIEHPALRRAMGLDAAPERTAVAVAADGGLPMRQAGSHQSAGLLRPSRPVAGSPVRTTSARPRSAATGRRFDRRALLESAT